MMDRILDPLLGGSVIVGTAAGVVALYGRYRTLPAFLSSPFLCGTTAHTCQSMFRTPTAALLGVPNSGLAILYYPLIGLGTLFHAPLVPLFAVSCSALLMTLWLAYVLLRDDLKCRVCWTGHVCNLVIWMILGSRLLGQ
jgi:uncharacterized membrane protein